MEETGKKRIRNKDNERKSGDYVMEVKLAAIGCRAFVYSKHNRRSLCCGINEKPLEPQLSGTEI